MNERENNRDESQWSNSPTLITRYATKSSKLIYSIEKNVFVVIGVVTALAVISIIDTLEIIGITDFIGEGLDDTIIATLSLISLAALVPILRLSFKSKRILEEWAQMFEYNSIKSSISMSITSTKRDDVMHAVAESIDEIREPLLQYLEKGNTPEIFDIQLHGYRYDVLLDQYTVNKERGDNLKKILADYGAIIIKVIDGKISRSDVDSFSNSLKAYSKEKQYNAMIGIAILIGKEVEPDVNIKFGKAGNIVLVSIDN